MLAISSVLLAAALSAPSAHAGDGPAFSHDFSPKVQWYDITDAGTVLVATNQAVVGIDPWTGDIAWERDDLKKVPEDGVTFLPGTPTAMVLEAEWKLGQVPKGTLHMLDVTTGQDLWSIQSGPVMWTQLRLSDMGVLMLCQEYTDKGVDWVMRYVDIKTGAVRWEQADYFQAKAPVLQSWKAHPDKKWSIKMTMEGNQPVVFVDDGAAYIELWHHKQGVTKRDAKSGAVLWSRPGKYAGKMVPTPAGGKPAMVVHDGKVYVTDNENQLWAYDVATGNPVWDEKKAPKQFGSILSVSPDGEHIVMTGHDGKKAFTMVVDDDTGVEAWKKPLKLKGMISYMNRLDDGRLVIAETVGTKSQVYVAQVADGSRTLAKPIKLAGSVDSASVEDNQLFATGSNGSKTYVGMWDLGTGASLWQGGKGYRAKGSVPNLVVEGDKVWFVDSRGNFTSLNRTDGSERFSVALPWQGKDESPATLMDRGDLLVTYSDQNVIGLNPDDGSVVFHSHYAPPPPTGLQVTAGVAMIAASAAAAGASAYNSAQAGYARGVQGPYSSTAAAYQDRADDAAAVSAAFGEAAAEVMRRSKASKATENYYFILTKVKEEDDKGVGLVRVSLDDGSEQGSVIIDQRDPDYEIDEIAGMLYLLRNDKQLDGYSFGSGVIDAPVAAAPAAPPVTEPAPTEEAPAEGGETE
ncbi:MAG: PQQ-binding-like beta-propeller repeat protein [Alphaproteobacteria bacterium]|nr:PQQ-binding-like beta-propeller repeat protein [Alphaproteobacteria bacterium]